VGRYRLHAFGSGLGPLEGFYEHRKVTSGSIKGGQFIEYVTITFSRRTVLHVVSWSVTDNPAVLCSTCLKI